MAVQGEDEDYGDYVTRCICGFTHDDGYMICCDQCSVWQHVECMKVNPKNLPDKYLCEECEPRQVDKKRARLIQMKKKDDISDFDEDDSSSDRGSHSASRSGSASPHLPSIKKRKKAQRTSSGGTLRVHELKAEARRNKKEKGDDGKKSAKKKSKHHHHQSSSHHHQSTATANHHHHTMMSGLQTLLTAASALEEQQQQQQQQQQMEKTGSSKSSCDHHSGALVTNNMFNCTTSPWKDPYKMIESNHYTDSLRTELSGRLEQLKKEAVVYTKEEYTGLGSFPLCLVRDVGSSRKGFISEAHIPEDEMILEYKAKVTVKEALCKDMEVPNQLLWKQRPCPFVYQYDKISGLIVCLDARNHGNTARFIRRSCNPNAELRHFFVNDDVHFGVYAVNHIPPEEEVTLPFDFPSDKCDYPVECACGRSSSCHLHNGGAAAHKGVKMRKTKKEQKVLVPPPPPPPPPPPVQQLSTETELVHTDTPIINRKPNIKGKIFQVDEDSNSSWASTGSISRKKIKRTFSQSSTSQQNSRDPTDSESEDIDGELAKKRKSREERKTEAVWKMFEKMEARGRKKLNSLSDSASHEDSTSTIAGNYSMSQAATVSGTATPRNDSKERRLSGHSRKVQLLPHGKHHLSSVSSSVDFLSPEHPDAFSSPPLTPSLSFTPHSLHHHDSIHQSSEQSSLIASSFATLPKLSFEVTPYLHPKYLLADFALPRKKAILRQWEMEQREIMMAAHTNGDNGQWMANGFALACMKAMEGKKPRQRGCLKHRWMDMHNKELQDESEMLSKLPHKKRFLQKWLDTSTSTEDPTQAATTGATSVMIPPPPTNLTPPSSSSSSPIFSTSQPREQPKTLIDPLPPSEPTTNLLSTVSDSSEPDVGVSDPPPHRRQQQESKDDTNDTIHSSLFDDFSDDDDFEDVSNDHHNDRDHGELSSKRHKHHRKEIKTTDNTSDATSINIAPVIKKPKDKDSMESPNVPVNEAVDHTSTGSKPDIISFESISPEPMVAIESKLVPTTSITAAAAAATVSAEPVEPVVNSGKEGYSSSIKLEQQAQRPTIEEISGEEDNQESVEMDISSSPLPPPIITTSNEAAVTTNIKDEESYRMSPSIDPVSNDGGTDKPMLLSPYSDASKPGGAKRKMSLLEYRNRARKPSDQPPRTSKPLLSQDIPQLSSVMTSPTPPSSSTSLLGTSSSVNSSGSGTASSHSFLSYSSSFLSGSSSASRTTKPLGVVGSPPVNSGTSVIGSTAIMGSTSTLAVATTPGTTRLFENVPPQFEPVSPDDGDRTPLTDEVSMTRPSSLTSLLPPPPPPPPQSSNNIPSITYNVPPHTPTSIPPNQQQMMWGGHPAAVPPMSGPMDVSHDPRRVNQAPLPHQGPPPPGPPNPDMYIHRAPPPPHHHQSPLSPQELMHPHYSHHHPHPPPHPPHPVPYNSMMHPTQQIRGPLPPGMPPCGPHTSGGGGYVQPHPPRMPHPPILHQAPPHHPNNNYYQ